MSRLRTIGRKLKSILVVGLIFFSGVIIGGMVSSSATLRDVTTKAFGSGPAPVRKLLIQHAKDGLQLDEDQQQLFTQILTETGAELNAATKPAQPQLAEILTRSELRLRQVLRQDQTSRFDRWAKQARKHWSTALSEQPAALAKDASQPALEK